MKTLVMFIVVFSTGSALVDDDPAQVVRNYFAAYSNGVVGSQLVAQFWMPVLVMNSRGAIASQIPATTFANNVEQFRADEVSRGWERSRINEIQSCILRNDLALVSVQFERQYKNGEALPDAVVYTLSNDMGWRLSSVTPVDIGVTIRCDKG